MFSTGCKCPNRKSENNIMPSCYTAPIKDGLEFKDFVMLCSRAMGAMIMMRDEPMDAPIPEKFEPSPYHAERLDEQVEELKKVGFMSLAEAEEAANKEYAEAMDNKNERIARKKFLKEKYKALLEKVEAWEPPTANHVGLKEFMAGQLVESIEFDCDVSSYEKMVITKKTGDEWRAEKIDKIKKEIEYSKKKHAEELKRTESRNKWLSDLRNSL